MHSFSPTQMRCPPPLKRGSSAQSNRSMCCSFFIHNSSHFHNPCTPAEDGSSSAQHNPHRSSASSPQVLQVDLWVILGYLFIKCSRKDGHILFLNRRTHGFTVRPSHPNHSPAEASPGVVRAVSCGGVTVRLVCETSCSDQGVSWRKEGRSLTEEKELRLQDIRRDDGGTYFCEVTDYYGRSRLAVQVIVTIQVLFFSPVAPVILVPQTSSAGDSLVCATEASPSASILWLRDSAPLDPSGPSVFSDTSICTTRSRLEPPASSNHSSHNYTCVATNRHGQSALTLLLQPTDQNHTKLDFLLMGCSRYFSSEICEGILENSNTEICEVALGKWNFSKKENSILFSQRSDSLYPLQKLRLYAKSGLDSPETASEEDAPEGKRLFNVTGFIVGMLPPLFNSYIIVKLGYRSRYAEERGEDYRFREEPFFISY
ncbi:uncharacterized protein CDAR_396961 [Caerostris darwini]|uniref:Ig-like domain-containing protein n=1 Tax=Caerostris darwini TaxID=1538125 RepID=A0AAV4Q4W7_9ARAC|nr:uncharacterized protein CDAR_396961 [Caerostris darwini]